jgi:hypothetical protein
MRSIRAASRWRPRFSQTVPHLRSGRRQSRGQAKGEGDIVRENIELIAWLFLCVLFEIVGTIVVSVYG